MAITALVPSQCVCMRICSRTDSSLLSAVVLRLQTPVASVASRGPAVCRLKMTSDSTQLIIAFWSVCVCLCLCVDTVDSADQVRWSSNSIESGNWLTCICVSPWKAELVAEASQCACVSFDHLAVNANTVTGTAANWAQCGLSTYIVIDSGQGWAVC